MKRRWFLLLLMGGCGPAPVLEDYSYARGYSGEDRLRAEVDYAAGKLHIAPSSSGALFEMDLRYDPTRFRPIGEYQPDGTVRIGAEKGRATRPDIKLGICGEHGGDPFSIRFCEDVGLDYVSCSPFRVPIARLAAAQAAAQKRG